MAYAGKFIDRNPTLQAAGFSSFKENEKMKDCFEYEVSKDEASPFVCQTGPMDYKLPPPRIDIYKGFHSDMRECIQPEVDHRFCDVLDKEFKETVYDSYWKMPTGRVPDQDPMLPAGMEYDKECFGRPTPRDVTAAELVSPPKSYLDIMEQSRVGHKMYTKTHDDYEPGEQIQRNYVEPFKQTLVWGKNTSCDPQGGCIQKVMTVKGDEDVLVSKILSDHRHRTKHLVGKVHAPNDNIGCVPEGHAFGRLNKRGVFGVGELLQDCDPSLDKLDLLDELSSINFLRNQIAKRELAFPHRDLLDTFHRIDSNHTNRLSLHTVYEVLADFELYPDRIPFEALMKRLNIMSSDEMIDYVKMADILNINVMFPDISKIEDVPKEMLHFETTNQFAQKYHHSEKFDTKGIPTAGVPPRPHISMESLVSPSIFTTYGLEPKEFFIPRSRGFLPTLLERLGYQVDHHQFGEIWNAAKDEKGCVSVYSFLKAFKSLQNC
ncbi:hypothetical protein J6590_017757 [Homalodisca vitripennis]|nr:hypothetical protein J6590_017757 [Homalodisca vitripennis]